MLSAGLASGGCDVEQRDETFRAVIYIILIIRGCGVLFASKLANIAANITRQRANIIS